MNTARKSATLAEDYREWLLERLRKDPERALGYLNAALEEDDLPTFLVALKDVIDAGIGMTGISKGTRLHRVSLYKMLSEEGNPTLKSLAAILDALGLRLHIAEKGQETIEKA
jgi:probable addiction module antidote protein